MRVFKQLFSKLSSLKFKRKTAIQKEIIYPENH